MTYSKLKRFSRLLVLTLYAGMGLTGGLAQAEGIYSTDLNPGAVGQDTISINVRNIDIQDFLSGLARSKKVNIIPSKDVKGNISVNLHNIPLSSAIRAVSRANGYQCILENGIYFIVKDENKKKQILGETIRSFRINFAEISEAKRVVEDILGKDKVTAHEDVKTLIVEGSPENISKIEHILKQIDYPPKQVLIVAKILEVSLGDSLSFGVDWEKTFTAGDFSGTLATQAMSIPKDSEGAQGLFLDIIKSNEKLKANLDALETRSDINVLATPKLLAVDGRAAEIIIGGKLGYYVVTTTDTSTVQSVEFLDTGTQLKLTPHIGNNGEILLDIHPEVSDGSIDALGLPSERTTEVTTSLMAEHGDTVFIGGLIRQAKEKVERKIPFLGSLPLIGAFFKRTEDREAKSEIIVLITPYIITADEKLIYQDKNDIVKRSENNFDKKRSTAGKLFRPEKMFDNIYQKDDDSSIQIKKRSGGYDPDPEVQ